MSVSYSRSTASSDRTAFFQAMVVPLIIAGSPLLFPRDPFADRMRVIFRPDPVRFAALKKTSSYGVEKPSGCRRWLNLEPPRSPSLTGRPTWPSVLTAVNHAPMNPENGLAPGQSIRGCIGDNGGVRFPGPHNRLRNARLLLLRASHALDPARLLLPRPPFPPSTPQAAPTQFRR